MKEKVVLDMSHRPSIRYFVHIGGRLLREKNPDEKSVIIYFEFLEALLWTFIFRSEHDLLRKLAIRLQKLIKGRHFLNDLAVHDQLTVRLTIVCWQINNFYKTKK